MDRKGKRLAALLCAVLMAVTLLPGQVWAEMYSAEDAPPVRHGGLQQSPVSGAGRDGKRHL